MAAVPLARARACGRRVWRPGRTVTPPRGPVAAVGSGERDFSALRFASRHARAIHQYPFPGRARRSPLEPRARTIDSDRLRHHLGRPPSGGGGSTPPARAAMPASADTTMLTDLLVRDERSLLLRGAPVSQPLHTGDSTDVFANPLCEHVFL